MAYCSKCGSEIDPNSSFCAACGTPVGGSQPTPPGPQQPAVPTAPYAQPGGYSRPPKGKGGKIALITILALIIIGAAVVLVLGFAAGPKWFVSSNDSNANSNTSTNNNNATAGGPEKTVDAFLRAMENKDANALIATLSPSSLSSLQSQMGGSTEPLATALGDYLFTYQSMKFSGVEYSTQVTGDTATVTVVEGTVTTVDENGERTAEDVRNSEEPVNFVLSNEKGSWYIDFDKTFMGGSQ
jgi:hypothetical protein